MIDIYCGGGQFWCLTTFASDPRVSVFLRFVWSVWFCCNPWQLRLDLYLFSVVRLKADFSLFSISIQLESR